MCQLSLLRDCFFYEKNYIEGYRKELNKNNEKKKK